MEENFFENLENETITEKEKMSENKEVKKVKPSLFIDEEDIVVKVNVLYSITTGDILSVFSGEASEDMTELEKERIGFYELIFKFSKVSYAQMKNYRKTCARYDYKVQQEIVDRLRLRDCYVYWHLKDWNLEDENGNKIPLTFQNNGVLSDESSNKFFSLSPAIIDTILNEYESKQNFIF
jgi:hypothetical protein